MVNLEFNSNDFKEKITEATAQEVAAIDHIVDTKRNVQEEMANNDQARKDLPGETRKMESLYRDHTSWSSEENSCANCLRSRSKSAGMGLIRREHGYAL